MLRERIVRSVKIIIICLMFFQVFTVFGQIDLLAPVAVDDSQATYKGVNVTIRVIENDYDLDLVGGIDPETVDLDPTKNGEQDSINRPGGKFKVNNAGVVTFEPKDDFLGAETATYTVKDNSGKISNVATITVTVTDLPNEVPTAVNDVATTSENSPVNINVVSNDSDSDGTINATTVDLNTGLAGIQNSNSNAQGNFTVNASGVVTYTPVTNFSGTTSVSYTVNDNDGATSNVATITITVTATPNKAPVAANDAVSTNENSPVTINVVSNDTDNDGTINVATVDLNTSQTGIQNSNTTAPGNFSANASGAVTFTPVNNFSGTASTTYTVNDNEGLVSNAATITITVTNAPNQAPTATNDAASTSENSGVTINVTANDSDPDGTIDKATVDLNTSQSGIQNSNTTPQGNYSVNTTGVVTYTPAKDFSGSTSITYAVNDNEGAKSNVATITISVSSVNAVPTAVPDITETELNVAVLINVVLNDTDTDGTIDPTSVDLSPGTTGVQKRMELPQGIFEANASGVVTYTPAKDFLGTASIAYSVKDNDGAVSNEAAINIEVREQILAVIDIPTGFTPNGDGANETWKILSMSGSHLEMPLAEVKVFDKRGALVYEARGFEKSWDGKLNGKSLPADSYYYTIDLKQAGKTFKGIVTILTDRP